MTNNMKYNRLRLGVVCCLFTLAQLSFSQRISRVQYVEANQELAVKEMKRTGIPASITLAQGILESDCGNSTLAKKSNNHFGIKCHNDWTGGKVYHDDDHKNECFRKYQSVYDSYMDHSDFLTGKSRYADLFTLETTDYKGWAHGLKKAGYATDPHYAARLIKIIEEDELWRYDSEQTKGKSNAKSKPVAAKNKKPVRKSDDFVISPFNSHKVEYNNGVRYVNVQEGDSFESISEEFNLQPWELYHYNDVDKSASISDFNQIYLQRKKNKAFRGNEQHKVKSGETIWYISHKYGVKMSRLLKYNHLGRGQEVEAGDVVNLRRVQ